jgi:MFS transporter, DHA1 family, multidrug resistance protein
MVLDIIRDAPAGQILRSLILKGRLLYHDETDSGQNAALEKEDDGTIVVNWYPDHDDDNPQNWSQTKKAMVALQINVYSFAVYCGSAIYVPGEAEIMHQFGLSYDVVELGLALYVLGYGIGPLLWSPMSEIPRFGRNIPYVWTFAVFWLLVLAAALVNNVPGLLILRFLQGFFGSPCLATAGASMADLYSELYLPYPVGVWVTFAFIAPAFGPILAGFSVVKEGWHWSMWELLWMSTPIFVVWFFFLPETSADAILLRRAARLRLKTGNSKIRTRAEIKRKNLTPGAIFVDAVIKPVEIMFKDPAILFANVYTGLLYGIYYSFFEVFPLIYVPIYDFNLGETGLIFLTIVVGAGIAMMLYFAYIHFRLIPATRKHGELVQEWRLRPALPFTLVFTMSLIGFGQSPESLRGPPLTSLGWTSARPEVHWIVGAIFLTFYCIAVYFILQCILVYIPFSYPDYAASLFASNDLCRSVFAFAAILYGRPMYMKLGIGQGTSLLGGLSAMGIVIEKGFDVQTKLTTLRSGCGYCMCSGPDCAPGRRSQ